MHIYVRIHVCSENVSKTTGVIQFTVRNYVQSKEGIVHRAMRRSSLDVRVYKKELKIFMIILSKEHLKC